MKAKIGKTYKCKGGYFRMPLEFKSDMVRYAVGRNANDLSGTKNWQTIEWFESSILFVI